MPPEVESPWMKWLSNGLFGDPLARDFRRRLGRFTWEMLEVVEIILSVDEDKLTVFKLITEQAGDFPDHFLNILNRGAEVFLCSSD